MKSLGNVCIFSTSWWDNLYVLLRSIRTYVFTRTLCVWINYAYIYISVVLYLFTFLSV